MGRGRGDYAEKRQTYVDSHGHKVKDVGAIFVAERYIEEGFEVVFCGTNEDSRRFDLIVKTADDKEHIKNIEVKRVTSNNPSKIASNIKIADTQISDGDTIAIVLPNFNNDSEGLAFAQAGIDEARRKNLIKGPIEVWFADKTKIEFPFDEEEE